MKPGLIADSLATGSGGSERLRVPCGSGYVPVERGDPVSDGTVPGDLVASVAEDSASSVFGGSAEDAPRPRDLLRTADVPPGMGSSANGGKLGREVLGG